MLASLLASLLLVLAASMFNLVRKEVILSSIGRDSQFAFYAADTAAECALYWDFRYQQFIAGSGDSSITCNEQTVSVSETDTGVFEFEYSVNTSVFAPNGYCARVTVTKTAEYPTTSIDARGYSTECNFLGTSARVLERAVELQY